jgi:HSP20 family protein
MFERMRPYDDGLLSQFRHLEQEMDELFSGGTTWTGTRNIRSLPSGSFPAVNVGQTADAVTVYLFAPGIDPKTLNTSIQQNLLAISGQRHVTLDKDATYYRQERFTGDFHRVISLPDDVDPERVEARYADGVVQVTVGRRASAKPRQIEIR